MIKNHKVFVELYDLPFTDRKDDRSGRVVSTGTLKIPDIIGIAVTRRTDLNAATILASYQILKEVAIEEVCNGKHVEFGLTYNSLGVEGVFIGDHPSWDSSIQHLILDASVTAEVRELIKQVVVEVLGMASSGLYVNTLTDVTTNKQNECITRGGGVNLVGVKFKIVGDDPAVGLYLTNIASGTDTKIPMTSILVNEPSKMSFIVPTNLPEGDYKLKIITQYSSSSGFLKEARTYIFDCVLESNSINSSLQ
jgi:hypothetical protein